MSSDWNGPDTLLIGIGNSGRQDDGLGWAFLEAIERQSVFHGQIQFRYQLQVEDAEMISHARQVIFVDAFRGELEGGFKWVPCVPSLSFEFSTHMLAPESVLCLCQKLYDHSPRAKLLLIQGACWELEIGLTDVAKVNLEQALKFFRSQHLMAAHNK